MIGKFLRWLLEAEERDMDVQRLQARLDAQESEKAARDRIEAHARAEITNCKQELHKEYGWSKKIAGIVFIVLTIFGIGTVRECNDKINSAIADMRTNVDNQIANLKTSTDSNITSFSAHLTVQIQSATNQIRTNLDQQILQVNTETRRQISTQFNEPIIKALIEKDAQEQVAAIARPLIMSDISSRIEPLELNLKNTFNSVAEKQEQLLALITQATNALGDLDETATFITKAILADHDDRKAFAFLNALQTNLNSKHQPQAKVLVTQIQSDYFGTSGTNRNLQSIPWIETGPASNRHSWDVTRIAASWREVPASQAYAYILFVANHTNITTEQKLNFIRGAYTSYEHNSLQAENLAGYIVSDYLQARYNPPFIYDSLEKAWLAYTKTNHLFPNINTNFYYDIIHFTDRDRTFTIKTNLPADNLVLFALKHPVKPGTITGKIINYSDGYVGPIEVIDTSSRFITVGLLNFSGYADKKFEFEYQIDTNAPTGETDPPLSKINDDGKFAP